MKPKFVIRLPLLLASSVTLALTGCWTAPNANVQPKGAPGLIQGAVPVEILQESVTVAAVDANARTLTLARHGGTSKVYNVADKVKNLDQVKIGDTVTATVNAELSVYILDHGQLPGANGTTHEKTPNFNAKVLLVDPSYRLLTLQFTNGDTITIKAGLEVRLQKMAPGDDVVVRANEITAIKIK